MSSLGIGDEGSVARAARMIQQLARHGLLFRLGVRVGQEETVDGKEEQERQSGPKRSMRIGMLVHAVPCLCRL